MLEKTTFGYELKASGYNKDAAKYAGINQNRNVVLSMMIAGGLAGLGGALMFMNDTGLSLTAMDNMRMEGFTGISVAFLGLTHPIGIIFSGVFVSYIFFGGSQIQSFGFSSQIIDMVIAVIIYFCAFVFLVKSVLSKIANRFALKKKKDGDV